MPRARNVAAVVIFAWFVARTLLVTIRSNTTSVDGEDRERDHDLEQRETALSRSRSLHHPIPCVVGALASGGWTCWL